MVQQVCAAYGLRTSTPPSITRVARGAVGQIWRLDLGAESYAVKELFWGADEQAVRQEAAQTAHLAAAGILLPASLPATSGQFLVRLPADLGGGWLRLYLWMDGVPINLAEPIRPAGRAGCSAGCTCMPRRRRASRIRGTRPLPAPPAGMSWRTRRSRRVPGGGQAWPRAPACCASWPGW